MKKNIIIIAIIIALVCTIILIVQRPKWVKYSNNPIIGDTTTGTIFDPNVINLHNNTYRMYISTRENASISYTDSTDGINWAPVKTVLTNDGNTKWDETINRCSVIKKDGIYRMYYTGQTRVSSMIGLAESKDGINFKKVKSEPIIIPERDYEHSNAMNPCVLFDEEEKIYKMWYSSGEQYEPDVICYATSANGIEWNKHDGNPVLQPSKAKEELDNYKIGGCDVHKLEDNTYLMFYIGYTDINTARIFYATSKDGINWNRSGKPIIWPSKFSFDSEATYKPAAIYNNEKKQWMLWYNGRTGTNEYIGLVYCTDEEFNNKYKEKLDEKNI